MVPALRSDVKLSHTSLQADGGAGRGTSPLKQLLSLLVEIVLAPHVSCLATDLYHPLYGYSGPVAQGLWRVVCRFHLMTANYPRNSTMYKLHYRGAYRVNIGVS